MEEKFAISIMLTEKSFINVTTNSLLVIVAFGFTIRGNDLKLYFPKEKNQF